jgi:hypothetical protein
MLAIALFAMAALTTSQSATTKSIIPIGIAIGLPAQLMIAMWPSLIGVYFLPANGTQLAAVAADRTGSTKIGNAVINHSFQPNTIFMWIVTVIVGMILAIALHGTASADTEIDVADATQPTAEAAVTPEATPEAPSETEAAPTEEPAETAAEPTEEAGETEAPTEAAVETPPPEVTP